MRNHPCHDPTCKIDERQEPRREPVYMDEMRDAFPPRVAAPEVLRQQWVEEHKAQSWYDEKTKLWTVWLRHDGKVIQPGRPTWTEAVDAAREVMASK